MSSTTLKKLRRKNLILFIEIGWRKCKRIWGEEQIYRTLIPQEWISIASLSKPGAVLFSQSDRFSWAREFSRPRKTKEALSFPFWWPFCQEGGEWCNIGISVFDRSEFLFMQALKQCINWTNYPHDWKKQYYTIKFLCFETFQAIVGFHLLKHKGSSIVCNCARQSCSSLQRPFSSVGRPFRPPINFLNPGKKV